MAENHFSKPFPFAITYQTFSDEALIVIVVTTDFILVFFLKFISVIQCNSQSVTEKI